MSIENQFPGLSPEQLAAMSRGIAGLESLPALIERLHGITAELSEARALTPALVLDRPLPGPWPEETPAPLSVDPAGSLWTRTRINLRQLPDLVIPKNAQDGVPVVSPYASGELRAEDFWRGIFVFDDPARTETVIIQSTFDGGVNFWNIGGSAFTGAFNSGPGNVAPSVAVLFGSQWRMRASAAAVAAERRFKVFIAEF